MKRVLRLALAVMLCSASAISAQGTISAAPVNFVRGTTPWDTSPTADFNGVSATLTQDHLFETGWWFRVAGDTQETVFPVPDSQSYVGAASQHTWNDVGARGLFSATEAAQVFNTQSVYGVPSGYVFMTMQITNLSGSNQLDLELFHFIDLDLAGAGSDSAALVELTPLTIMALTDPSGNTAQYLSTPDFTGYLVRPFGATDVAAVLSDTSVTNFDNTGLPFGPGDFTAGFQHSLSIAPGASTGVLVIFMVNATGFCNNLLGLYCDGFESSDLFFWSASQL
jgi:hypothetical protein